MPRVTFNTSFHPYRNALVQLPTLGSFEDLEPSNNIRKTSHSGGDITQLAICSDQANEQRVPDGLTGGAQGEVKQEAGCTTGSTTPARPKDITDSNVEVEPQSISEALELQRQVATPRRKVGSNQRSVRSGSYCRKSIPSQDPFDHPRSRRVRGKEFLTRWHALTSSDMIESPPPLLKGHSGLLNLDIFLHVHTVAIEMARGSSQFDDSIWDFIKAWIWDADKSCWENISYGDLRQFAVGERYALTINSCFEPDWVQSKSLKVSDRYCKLHKS